MRTVGVIGGGAAGMMAAISAAEQGAKVTILEANDRLGRKILSTGNGKCNLGNEKLGPDDYYTGDPELLKKCLCRFSAGDTVNFFRKIGLLIKSKGGYLYPVSEQASSVLDVLRFEVESAGIEVVTGCRIVKIEKTGQTERSGQTDRTGQITSMEQAKRDNVAEDIRVWSGEKSFVFDRVVLAAGGRAAPKTGSDGSGFSLAGQLGHSLIPTVPALVQLKCREPFLKSVAGVRAEAEITLMTAGENGSREREVRGHSAFCDAECVAERITERGELQLTEYGISGIPVFQVSRQVNYRLLEGREVEIAIDFLPDHTPEAYEQLYISRMLLLGQRTVEEFFAGMLNKKLMQLFIRLAGLKPTEDIETADRERIKKVFELCRRFTVHVTGDNGYDNAQVCAGGVPLSEVTEDLESAKVPGVYFAGEILDVDGRCGGYNLQWAWTSGYIAGTAATT